MFLSCVPSQGRMDGAVSSYCFPCSKAAQCHLQLEFRVLVPLAPHQCLEVAGSYLPRDSL